MGRANGMKDRMDFDEKITKFPEILLTEELSYIIIGMICCQ